MDFSSLVPVSRHVDGVVEMMLDATQGFSRPLTKERLFNWHAALFPTERSSLRKITVGSWRLPDTGKMQVVCGPIGKEIVHFEAPDAMRLEKEMHVFLSWFNKALPIDPIIKAGLAHFWFVTIHPFEDGNGRIARAICEMALARADGLPERFYSLSSQIETERKQYYDQLERAQRGTLEITHWLQWFLHCLGHAVFRAETTVKHILFKARLWEKINQQTINERQRKIINLMLERDFKGY